MFFRADTVTTALALLKQMVTGWGTAGTGLVSPMVLFVIAMMLALQFAPHRSAEVLQDRISALRPWVMGVGFATALFVIATLGPQGVAPFIYFQF
ncbi:MAG: hypothetical protein ACXWE5_03240 [Actinomycetota bacterium]